MSCRCDYAPQLTSPRLWLDQERDEDRLGLDSATRQRLDNVLASSGHHTSTAAMWYRRSGVVCERCLAKFVPYQLDQS